MVVFKLLSHKAELLSFQMNERGGRIFLLLYSSTIKKLLRVQTSAKASHYPHMALSEMHHPSKFETLDSDGDRDHPHSLINCSLYHCELS